MASHGAGLVLLMCVFLNHAVHHAAAAKGASVDTAAVRTQLGSTATAATQQVVTVTVDNNQPLRNASGMLMDAADGCIMRWEADGMFWMYAMQYGLCQEESPKGCTNGTIGNCGFRLDHKIGVWTSPTLQSGTWTYVGDALPTSKRPPGVYYRPKVLFNELTRKYVLWANYEEAAAQSVSEYVVATSDVPQGPFTVVKSKVALFFSEVGDFDLFKDTDGTAYIMYGSHGAGKCQNVEQLDASYTGSTLKHSGPMSPPRVEAPSLFRRNDVYYALFGQDCCFCAEGSGVMVYTAPHPLGPWSPQAPPTNVGRFHGGPLNGTSISRAQQNFVIPIRQPASRTGGEDDGTLYMWTGNRWQSAPDHLKGNDLQYWWPLSWNETTGAILMQQRVSTFTFKVIGAGTRAASGAPGASRMHRPTAAQLT